MSLGMFEAQKALLLLTVDLIEKFDKRKRRRSDSESETDSEKEEVQARKRQRCVQQPRNRGFFHNNYNSARKSPEIFEHLVRIEVAVFDYIHRQFKPKLPPLSNNEVMEADERIFLTLQ